MNFENSVQLEFLKAALNFGLLLISWGIGQRIIAFYDLQRKRREIDLNTEVNFQSLYGEFKDIGRLWRIFKKQDNASTLAPANTRWMLLARASSAESRMESLLMKLSTERVLTPSEQRMLGLFRQAYQQLRESIRDDKEIKLGFSDPEYHFFNVLACRVALLVARAPQADDGISEQYRVENLGAIAGVREEEYQKAIAKYSQGGNV